MDIIDNLPSNIGVLTSSKSTCRFIVGTSTSGWTLDNCDYLCDGTDDNVEIQAAIDALPDTGGEILILDGTYNISQSIKIEKNNVHLSGSGNPVLKREFASSSGFTGIISIKSVGCELSHICFNGNCDTYKTEKDYAILITGSNYSYEKGTRIHDNIFTGIYNGIYIELHRSVQIYNNYMRGNLTGYSSGRYGIYIPYSVYIKVFNNVIERFTYGIYSSAAERWNIDSNIFSVVSYPIYIKTSITDSSSINASERYIQIINNQITYGTIMISGIRGMEISGNQFTSFSTPISLTYCANIHIVNNELGPSDEAASSSYSGISISNSTRISIVGNSISTPIERSNMNFIGRVPDYCALIQLESSTYCLISGNYLSYDEATPTSSNYTLRLKGTGNNYNFVTNNYFIGKNYTSDGGTGNKFVNNENI